MKSAQVLRYCSRDWVACSLLLSDFAMLHLHGIANSLREVLRCIYMQPSIYFVNPKICSFPFYASHLSNNRMAQPLDVQLQKEHSTRVNAKIVEEVYMDILNTPLFGSHSQL